MPEALTNSTDDKRAIVEQMVAQGRSEEEIASFIQGGSLPEEPVQQEPIEQPDQDRLRLHVERMVKEGNSEEEIGSFIQKYNSGEYKTPEIVENPEFMENIPDEIKAEVEDVYNIQGTEGVLAYLRKRGADDEALEQALDKVPWLGGVLGFDQEDKKNIIDGWDNFKLTLQQAYPNLNLATSRIARSIFGEEEVDAWVEKHGKGSFLAKGLSREEQQQNLDKIRVLQAQHKDTSAIVGSIENGDIAGTLSGIISAPLSLASTVGNTIQTGGAGLFTDMFASTYLDVNEARAEAQGITVDELISQGKDSVAAPVAFASMMTALEGIGMGALGKQILRTAPPGWKRKVIDVLMSSNVEGTTEFLQHGLEVAAKTWETSGGNTEETAKDFIDSLFTKDALESYAQGFFASGTTATAFAPVKKLVASRRENGDQIDEKLHEHGVIEDEKKSNPDLSPDVVDGMIDAQNEIIQEAEELVKEPAREVVDVNQEEKTELERISDEVDEYHRRLGIVEADANMDPETKETLVKGLEDKIARANEHGRQVAQAATVRAQELNKKEVSDIKEISKIREAQEKIDQKREAIREKKEALAAAPEPNPGSTAKIKQDETALNKEESQLGEQLALFPKETVTEVEQSDNPEVLLQEVEERQALIEQEKHDDPIGHLAEKFKEEVLEPIQYETKPTVGQPLVKLTTPDQVTNARTELDRSVEGNRRGEKIGDNYIAANERQAYAISRGAGKRGLTGNVTKNPAGDYIVTVKAPTVKAPKPTPSRAKITNPYVRQVVGKVKRYFGNAVDVAIVPYEQLGAFGRVTQENGRVKIYISDGNAANPGVKLDTLFHEPAHILYQLFNGSTDPKVKALANRIDELIVNTQEYKDTLSNPAYAGKLTEKGYRQEAFAKYFGNYAKDSTFGSETLNKVLQRLADYVKTKFGVDILADKLSLKDISNMILADIQSGKPTLVTFDDKIARDSFVKSQQESFQDLVKKENDFLDAADQSLEEGNDAQAQKDRISASTEASIREAQELKGETYKGTPEANNEALSPTLLEDIKTFLSDAVNIGAAIKKIRSNAAAAPLKNLKPRTVAKSLADRLAIGNYQPLTAFAAGVGRGLDLGVDTDLDTLEATKVQLAAGWEALKPLIEAGIVELQRGIGETTQERDQIVVKFVPGQESRLDSFIRGSNLIEGDPNEYNQPHFAPVKMNKWVTKGLRLISRRVPAAARMTPKTHPKVYQVINKANNIAYQVNSKMLSVFQSIPSQDLVKIPGETARLRDYLYKKHSKAEKARLRSELSPKEINAISEVLSRDRIMVQAARHLPEGAQQDFYFMHNFDFRGRVYPASAGFNYQGTKLAQSLLTFGKKSPIGKEGWKWMLIKAADHHGGPKTSLAEDRLEFAREQLAEWMEIAKDPTSKENMAKWNNPQIDSPFLFLSHIMEIAEAVNHPGGIENFQSGLPLHFDATNSGAQFLSKITNDKEAAEKVNLVAPGDVLEDRKDLYLDVADIVWNDPKKPLTAEFYNENKNKLDAKSKEVSELDSLVEEAETDAEKKKIGNQIAKHKDFDLLSRIFWSNPEISTKMRRTLAKGPVMTRFYGAGISKMAEQLYAKHKPVKDENGNYTKDSIPGLTLMYSRWLAAQLHAGTKEAMQGPVRFMDAVTEMATTLANFGDNPVHLKGPVTGFEFVQDYRYEGGKNKFQLKGYPGNDSSILEGNKTRVLNVVFNVGEGGIDKRKIQSATAANVTHFLDSQLPQYLINESNFEVQTIHDSFGVVPGNAQNLFDGVREGFDTGVFGDNYLRDLIQQLTYEQEVADQYYEELNVDTLDQTQTKDNPFAFDDNHSEVVNAAQESKTTDAGVHSEIYDIFGKGKQVLKEDDVAAAKIKGKELEKTWLGKRLKWLAPAAADDYHGLIERIAGIKTKGADFIKNNITNKFTQGYRDYIAKSARIRTDISDRLAAIKKAGIKLNDEAGTFAGNKITKALAIKIYSAGRDAWTNTSATQQEVDAVFDLIDSNPSLKEYTDYLIDNNILNPADGVNYIDRTIDGDVAMYINSTLYKESMVESGFTEAADTYFNKAAMNTIRANYGNQYADALQDSLDRMKGGNRVSQGDKLGKGLNTWLTRSIGGIMFLNFRSAALQILSITNYATAVKNPAKFMANLFHPSTWKEGLKLYNSPYLRERRARAGFDINANEIAEQLKGRGFGGLIEWILKKGFIATSAVDSVAIAFGGAAAMKAGMTQEQWMEQTEEAQQSSRPDRISEWQASGASRFLLAFANTPAQYFRLAQKAARVIKSPNSTREDKIKAVSRIGYYMAIQNIIFAAAQQALTGEDPEEEAKVALNSMSDSILRGMGLYGHIASTVKNSILEAVRQEGKQNPDHLASALKLVQVSPPVSKKIQDLQKVGNAWKYDKKEKGLKNPWLTTGSELTAFATNIPADWAQRKAQAVGELAEDQYSGWEKFFLLAGWSEYNFRDKDVKSNKKNKPKFKRFSRNVKKFKRN